MNKKKLPAEKNPAVLAFEALKGNEDVNLSDWTPQHINEAALGLLDVPVPQNKRGVQLYRQLCRDVFAKAVWSSPPFVTMKVIEHDKQIMFED